ncbi:hypothetical protein [Halomicrobium katesii]|uniref:hypothetical protein n=1 Tax=Halomicrobium katesii TaxID=437163 RepID=UPI0012BAEEB7|nr:hypothetical protein [Halomicrobium katesii]
MSKESKSNSFARQATVYYVANNQIQSETIALGRPSYDNSSNSEIDTESAHYCDIYVSVLDATGTSDDCISNSCIALAAAGSVVAVLSCLGSLGLLCIAGLSIGVASITDCIGCDEMWEGYISVDQHWLEETLDAKVTNPCSYFTPDRPGAVSKCGLEDMSTKEDYNYAECN